MTSSDLYNARAWANRAHQDARERRMDAATIAMTVALCDLITHIETLEMADRSAPINIIPPTIIEGGQEHGRP